LLSVYKTGNMFQLIKPPSGQFINYIEGIFSKCAYCWIRIIYKSYDNKSY